MKKLTLLFLFLGFVIASFGQVDIAKNKLAKRGEVYFKFNKSIYGVPYISSLVSVDRVKGDTIYAFANSAEFSRFLNLNIQFQVLDSEGESVDPNLITAQKSAWSYYPSYTQYETLMQDFAANHPQICRLVNLGTLSSGRKILVLRISDNPDSLEAEPRFFYTSTMHGDEVTGYNFLLRFADKLLSSYGTDSSITNLIDSVDIWINPNANPDGTYYGGNSSVNNARRYNANNVDLNRNFRDPDSQHPDGNAYQPETQIFMGFADTMHFTMSANFHGGAEVVNYPWDTWYKLTADDSWWRFVSSEYADTVHFYSNQNGYMTDPYNSGITNGYAWYTMDGGRQDFMNYFQRCREVTFEISSTKILQTNKLDTTWYYSKNAFFNYVNQVRYGVKGFVTDSATGLPIKAKVFINGHDMDSSHVWSSLPHGDYYRLLDSGYYDITYSKQGYYPKTINVRVDRYASTKQDVQLAKIIDFVEERENAEIEIFPNPANDIIRFDVAFRADFFEISDLQGRNLKAGKIVTGEKTIQLSDLPSGYYMLKISGENKEVKARLVII